MYCPKCGQKQGNENAKFCNKCGSSLTLGQQPTQTVTQVVGPTQSSKGRRKIPLVAILVACTAIVFGVVALLLLRPKTTDVLPAKDSVALFSSDMGVLANKDSTAHLRVRASQDTNEVQIKDESGNVLTTVDSSSMQDAGDGFKWADLELRVSDLDPGILRLYAVATSEGNEVPNSQASELPIPVVPEQKAPPVPSASNWVLADACDWTDKNYRDAKGEDAAKALTEHLSQDPRVSSVRQYGSTVMFTAQNSEEPNDVTLHCISLEPAEQGMLGSGSDHVFTTSGPAVEAFETYEAQPDAPLTVGLGITAGDTITSGDVLLLEPTPGLMEDDPKREVRDAAKGYANALGGKLTVKENDDALRSLLMGDLYDAGVALIRAHGISASGSGTSLMQMRAAKRSANGPWEEIRKDLYAYTSGITEYSPVDVGSLFFGFADKPDTWSCAVTARATSEPGAWEVGVSATPSLIRSRYSAKPFDGCILCLSTCGGLANESFDKWASDDSRGIQMLTGYSEAVSQKDDAQMVCDLLSGLVTQSDEGEQWRCQNAGEALGESSDLLPVQSDSDLDSSAESYAKGNKNVFAKGTGSLRGKVIGRDKNAVPNANVKALRYYGRTFAPQGEGKTGADGSFKVANLPCGRYVLVVQSGEQEAQVTVVLDRETVDGGTISLDVAQGKPTTEPEQTSKPKQTSEPKQTPKPEPAPAVAVDLGAANAGVDADNEFYYIGTGSNSQENGAPAKPKVARVRRDDDSKCEILWEGDSANGTTTLRKIGNNIVVASSPWSSNEVSITSMKADGSDAKVIVKADKIGKYHSNHIFVCSDDRVFYGAVFGNNWQVRSCGIDGTDDKLLCEGTTSGSSTSIDILACTNGTVYFCVPAGSSSLQSQLLCSVSTGGGNYNEVLTTNGHVNPQVVGERIHNIENNVLVSYALGGEDRHEIATLPSAVSSAYIWNISPRYAFVMGSAKSFEDGGVFRIDLQTGTTEKVGSMEQYASISIVDDVLIASFIDGSLARWNLNLEKQSDIWPNASASKVTAISSPISDSDPGENPSDNTEAKLAEFEERFSGLKASYENDPRVGGNLTEMSHAIIEHADNLITLMEDIYSYAESIPSIDKDSLQQSQNEWEASLQIRLDELTEYNRRQRYSNYKIEYPGAKVEAAEKRIDALLEMIRDA